jgi:hypothetical protein
MASIPGTEGKDDLTDTAGDDYITPGLDDDIIVLGAGRDTVEIEPVGGNDRIYGFKSGEDTLVLNYFPNLNGPNDVPPDMVENDFLHHEATVALSDISNIPTMNGVEFRETTGVSLQDMAFNTGPDYDPDFVPSILGVTPGLGPPTVDYGNYVAPPPPPPPPEVIPYGDDHHVEGVPEPPPPDPWWDIF